MKNFILYFVLFIMVNAQEIPVHSIYNDYYEYQIDRGINWENNSSLSSARWQDISNPIVDSDKDTIKYFFELNYNLGVHDKKLGNSLGLYSHSLFKKYFYTYLYARVVSDVDIFPRYTGIPRDINRFGFNSGEVDMSGIGFDNKTFIFQLGRGRIGQGAGNEKIQLALNQNSPSYDHFIYGIKLNNWKLRFYNGYLETIDSANRYISGRSIEKKINNKMIVSFSETVIYSGENRSFDIAYLNPISTHLEIELNNRQNQTGTSSGNAVWQASIDWMFDNRLRFSGNLLIDEFVLDEIEKQSGKIHSLAGAFRLAWSPYDLNPFITFHASFISVGPHTYRHEIGDNNFVQRSFPIGWYGGSDSEEVIIGIKYLRKKQTIYNLDIRLNNSGENSIVNDPYMAYNDYNKTSNFPSGDAITSKIINGGINSKLSKKFSFQCKMEYKKINNNYNANIFIGLSYHFLDTNIF